MPIDFQPDKAEPEIDFQPSAAGIDFQPDEPKKTATELAADPDFNPAAYADESGDEDTAFEAREILRNRSFGEKAASFGNTLLKPETWKGAAESAAKFGAGLVVTPLHTVAQAGATAGAPIARAAGADKTADFLENEQQTLGAETVLAAQGIEESLKSLGRGARNLATSGDERQRFKDEIAAYRNQKSIGEGRPVNTGVVAATSEALTGSKPSDTFSPEAIEAQGGRPASTLIAEMGAASADPTNLMIPLAEKIPGIAKVTGGAVQTVGKALKVPQKVINYIPKVANLSKEASTATKVAGAAVLGYEALQHPEEAAKLAGIVALGKAFGWTGEALDQQGRALRTGIPSALDTAAQSAASAGRRATGVNAQRMVGNTAVNAVTGAIALEPVDYLQAEGDPRRMAEALIGNFALGATFGLPGEVFNRRQMANIAAYRLAEHGRQQFSENPDFGAHQAQLNRFNAADRSAIEKLRGYLFGGLGTELLVVDGATYANKVAATGIGANTRGYFARIGNAIYINADAVAPGAKPLTPGQQAAKAADTVGHEAGHAVVRFLINAGRQSDADGLFAAIRDNLTPEQLASLTSEYRGALSKSTPAKEQGGLGWKRPETADVRKQIDDQIAQDNPEDAIIEENLSEITRSILEGEDIASFTLPKPVAEKITDGAIRWLENHKFISKIDESADLGFKAKAVREATRRMRETLYQTGQRAQKSVEEGQTAMQKIVDLRQKIAAIPPATPGAPAAQVAAGSRMRAEMEKELAKLEADLGINQPTVEQRIAELQPIAARPITGQTSMAERDQIVKAKAELQKLTREQRNEAPEAVKTQRAVNGSNNKAAAEARRMLRSSSSTYSADFIKRSFDEAIAAWPDKSIPVTPAFLFNYTRSTKMERAKMIAELNGTPQATPSGPPATQANTTPPPAPTAEPAVPPEATPAGTPEPQAKVVKPRTVNYPKLPPANEDSTGAEIPDIFNDIFESGGGGIFWKGQSKEEIHDLLKPLTAKQADDLMAILASDDPRNAPDAVANGINYNTGKNLDWQSLIRTIASDYIARKEGGAGNDLQSQFDRQMEEAEAEERRRYENQPPTDESDTPPPDPFSESPTVAVAEQPQAEPSEEPGSLSPDEIEEIAAMAREDFLKDKEPAKTGPNKGKHTKKAQQDADREAFRAVSQAHAATLPANYDGIKATESPLGEPEVSGRIRPGRPFDDYLLRLANVTSEQLATIMAMQDRIGQTISIEYTHAAGAPGEPSFRATRRAAQKASPAKGRTDRGEGQTETKVILPQKVKFNFGAKTFTVLGTNAEKLLANYGWAEEAMAAAGEEMPYQGIHDPRLVADIKGLQANHAAGYTWDGAPIEGLTDRPLATNRPDGEGAPYQGFMDEDGMPDLHRFEFVNLLLGNEGARIGKRGETPIQKAKMTLGIQNRGDVSDPVTAEGETNQLRDRLNTALGPQPLMDADGNPTDKTDRWSAVFMEDPLNEAISVENIAAINPTVERGESPLHEHGYKGDLDRHLGNLKTADTEQERIAAAGRFMPETAGAEDATEGVKASAARLWKQKGTESPFFKKWFGKSKAIDENGKPKVMVHGSNQEISEFRTTGIEKNKWTTEWSVLGAFFDPTGDTNMVQGYANMAVNQRGGIPTVTKAYLSIQKPKRMSAAAFEKIKTEQDALNLRKKLESQGYDGIIMTSRDWADTKDVDVEWVAFHPTQIKSATGNEGTFDASNPDIRFMPEQEQRRGQLHPGYVVRQLGRDEAQDLDSDEGAWWLFSVDPRDGESEIVQAGTPDLTEQEAINNAIEDASKIGEMAIGSFESAPAQRPSAQFRPFNENDWMGLSGAEEFANGDQPRTGTAKIVIDDQPTEVQIVMDRNGIDVMTKEGQTWHVEYSDAGIIVTNANQAINNVQNALSGKTDGLWNAITEQGEGVLEPWTGAQTARPARPTKGTARISRPPEQAAPATPRYEARRGMGESWHVVNSETGTIQNMWSTEQRARDEAASLTQRAQAQTPPARVEPPSPRTSMPTLRAPQGALAPTSPLADIHADLDAKLAEQQDGLKRKMEQITEQIDGYGTTPQALHEGRAERAELEEFRRQLVEDHQNLNMLRESLRTVAPTTEQEFPMAYAQLRRLEVRGLISHEQSVEARAKLSERQDQMIADRIIAEESAKPERARQSRIQAKIRVVQREATQERMEKQSIWDDLLRAKDVKNMPKIARLWQQVSRNDDAFSFPKTKATDPAEIAKEMSTTKSPMTVSVHRNSITFQTSNGSITINDTDSASPTIYASGAGSRGKKEGGGTQLYQAAFAWAHNNGIVMHPSNALSTINAYVRRTSNMLSSALRFGTTRHMIPDNAQGVKNWQTPAAPKNEFAVQYTEAAGEGLAGEIVEDERADQMVFSTREEANRYIRQHQLEGLAEIAPDKQQAKDQAAADANNIAQLAMRESEQVMRAVPALQGIDFDFKTGKMTTSDGNEVTPAHLTTRLEAAGKAQTYEKGIGLSTAQRAIITAAALRQAEGADFSRADRGRGNRVLKNQGKLLYMPETDTIADLRRDFHKTSLITTAAAKEALGARPKYLDQVMRFMARQREKTVAGKLSKRDVAKAYLLTLGSIGAAGINVDTFEKNAGLKVPPRFRSIEQTGEKIRPEEAVALWMGTPDGQKALDEIDAGTATSDSFAGLLKVRDVFGRNDIRNNGLRVGGNKRTLANVQQVTDEINAAKGDVGKISDALQSLTGISNGKIGFIKHLLGFGDTPTIDAVELNFWLTGKGDTRGATGKRADLVRRIKERGMKDEDGLGGEVADRIGTQIKKLASQYDLDPETAPHIIHHWLWDNAKGAETKHAGMMEAQAKYMPEAVQFTPSANPILRKAQEAYRASEVVGQPFTQEGIDRQANRIGRIPEELVPFIDPEDEADSVHQLTYYAGKKMGSKVAPPSDQIYRPAVRLKNGEIAWHPKASIHGQALYMYLDEKNTDHSTVDAEDEVYGSGGLAPNGHYYEDSFIGDAIDDYGSIRDNGGTHPNLGFMPDTGTPEEGGTPGERLAREAEQSGVVLSMAALKGLIAGDQEAMDRIRTRIEQKTGKPARFMPEDGPGGSTERRLLAGLIRKELSSDYWKKQVADKFQGTNAWITPDGKWLNVDDHMEAMPTYVTGRHEDQQVSYEDMNAAGYGRVVKMQDGKLMLDHTNPTNAQLREVKNTAIENGLEFAHEQGRKWFPGAFMPDQPERIQMSNASISRGAGLQFLPAHHGTPHKVDKFSLDKIGTGEGAQAYGWGLYFAENEGVAEDYRRNLSTHLVMTDADGNQIKPDGMIEKEVADSIHAMNRTTNLSVDSIIEKMMSEYRTKMQREKGAILRLAQMKVAALRKWRNKGIKIEQGGNKYTVDLDVTDDEVLDWDKPIKDQPNAEALMQIWDQIDPKKSWVKKETIKRDDPLLTGQALYQAIANEGNATSAYDAKAASEKLRSLGIVGIKYLDRGSRKWVRQDGDAWIVVKSTAPMNAVKMGDKGTELSRHASKEEAQAALKKEQTSNFVIFDESRIRITHENGTPVTPQERQEAIGEKQGGSFMPEGQEFTSAATSLDQIPATFKRMPTSKGQRNADIGGGAYDTGTDYLAEKGVENIVVDPYNRTPEHNEAAQASIDAEPTDTATVNNVLNVIKEPKFRATVIQQAAKAIKPDGTAFFLIHEGHTAKDRKAGDGIGRQTTKGWQNYKKTAEYIGEIEQHFGKVVKRGNILVATEPR